VTIPLPTAAPVQVTFPGEDELYVRIGSVTATQSRVGFELIGFARRIPAGAQVIGEAGVTTTVAEPIEGLDVQSAVLTSVAGLGPMQLLRIVRSQSMLVRPSPYYPFPAETTLVAVRVVENDSAATPIGGATVTIGKINAAAPATKTLGGLHLHQFALGGTSFIVLDDLHLATTTNDRGDAIVYFPGEKPVSAVEVTISKTQYQPVTTVIAVTAGQRAFQSVVLNRM
jgi:hypothetical protein